MHSVGSDKVGHFGQWHDPRRRGESAVGPVFGAKPPPAAVDVVASGSVPEGGHVSRSTNPPRVADIGEPGFSNEAVRDIDAGAINGVV